MKNKTSQAIHLARMIAQYQVFNLEPHTWILICNMKPSAIWPRDLTDYSGLYYNMNYTALRKRMVREEFGL